MDDQAALGLGFLGLIMMVGAPIVSIFIVWAIIRSGSRATDIVKRLDQIAKMLEERR